MKLWGSVTALPHGHRHGYGAMPIAIAATYDTYEAALLKGLPSTLRCPRDCLGFLSLLGSRVDRPVVLLVPDGTELVAAERVLSVALVRCQICGGRFRLLPADVLPHKHFGLAMIASIASRALPAASHGACTTANADSAAPTARDRPTACLEP